MNQLRTALEWMAAAIVAVAFLLPALTIAAPPTLPQRQWTGFELAAAGLAVARGAGDRAGGYADSAERLTFVAEIEQRQREQAATGGAAGTQVVTASGIFRLARYLPMELLAAAACWLVLLAGMALRSPAIGFTAAGLGTMFALFAIVLFAWLAGAAKVQWHLAQPGSGAPVHVGAAMYLLLAGFALAMVVVRPEPERD